MKNKRAHSAKFKMNLHSYSAQLPSPSNMVCITSKSGSVSIKKSIGGAHVGIWSVGRFCKYICLVAIIPPPSENKDAISIRDLLITICKPGIIRINPHNAMKPKDHRWRTHNGHGS